MAKKTKLPPLRSREELEHAADRYAELSVQKRQLEAKRDEAIQAIMDEHNPAILILDEEMDALEAQAKTYAAAYRKDLFPGPEKTISTPLTKVSLRTSPGALKPLTKDWTDEVIVQKVEELFGDDYIRTTKEINKERIAAEFGEDPEKLASVGLKLHKPEKFSIVPKVDVAA